MSLVGPFQFENIDSCNRVCQRVSEPHWQLLLKACTLFGISPPTMHITQPKSRQAQKRTSQLKRKRNRQDVDYKE